MIRTEDLMALREGRLTLNEFVRMARGDFVKLAARISHDAPAWVGVDDLVQEMLLVVEPSVVEWRPGDYPIKRFVVFRACCVAHRMIERAQKYQTFEIEQDGKVDASDLEHTNPEELALEMEHRNRLLARLPKTATQLAVLRSILRTQSIDHSVRDLISDPRTMVMFAADDDLVKLKIRRALTMVARRVQGQQSQK